MLLPLAAPPPSAAAAAARDVVPGGLNGGGAFAFAGVARGVDRGVVTRAVIDFESVDALVHALGAQRVRRVEAARLADEPQDAARLPQAGAVLELEHGSGTPQRLRLELLPLGEGEAAVLKVDAGDRHVPPADGDDARGAAHLYRTITKHHNAGMRESDADARAERAINHVLRESPSHRDSDQR